MLPCKFRKNTLSKMRQRQRAARKKVVAAVSRCERLQANRRAERAFLRQRRNDGAYDRFFCKEKSEWSKVHSDVATNAIFDTGCIGLQSCIEMQPKKCMQPTDKL